MKKLFRRTLVAVALGTCVASVGLARGAEPAETSPVAVKAGKATLSPENTHLQFVCAHRREKPDPRTGTFKKFSGEAEVDSQAKTLKSLTLEIDANSLSTEFTKLTGHLKSPDFFDTREHPKASFKSTKVIPGDKPGAVTITGDLTLHGVTKPIKAPATVTFTDDGLTLSSKFAIDRSEFGMSYGADAVENTVSLTFVVGTKNKVLADAN